jgi:hypothetical protein
MTFEEFMREEEEREKQRREERIALEQRLDAKAEAKAKIVDVEALKKQKKADQLALKKRIEDEAVARYAEGCKKHYELSDPPTGPVQWLVFDRATGELLGEAKTWRAHQAWVQLNPRRVEKDGTSTMIGFNAVRCVLRSDWEEAENKFRERKRSNGKANAQ